MATSTGLLGSTSTTAAGKPVDYTKQINALYQQSLGRDAEQAGVEHWAKILASGTSLADVQKSIAGSDEANVYKSTQGTPKALADSAWQATATYKPTTQTVSEKSTVQNQLANITANGSALNTQAETDARKAMTSRGLLNSSIAVGAAQDAVLRNAMPIAQQDAQTYANTDAANASFKNNADQFNASQQNAMTGQLISSNTSLAVADKNIAAQSALTDKQLASQQSIADKENTVKLQLQQIDAQTKQMLAGLDEQTKLKVQEIDARDKQLLQTNISAANAYAQLAQALSSISTSTTMDAAAKQQATDNQINLFRQNLQALGKVSGLDLSKYFEQVTAPTSAQGNTTGDPAANLANAQQAAGNAAGML